MFFGILFVLAQPAADEPKGRHKLDCPVRVARLTAGRRPVRCVPCGECRRIWTCSLPGCTVLAQLPGWIEDYNESHPHRGLRMRSPREFIRSQSQPAPCPV